MTQQDSGQKCARNAHARVTQTTHGHFYIEAAPFYTSIRIEELLCQNERGIRPRLRETHSFTLAHLVFDDEKHLFLHVRGSDQPWRWQIWGAPRPYTHFLQLCIHIRSPRCTCASDRLETIHASMELSYEPAGVQLQGVEVAVAFC